MEQTFSFAVTPMNPEALRSQVRNALEKRNEMLSRRQNPKMWDVIDKLNSVEKVPAAVSENRRRRRSFLGVVNWLLGVVLLLPGLLEPSKLLLPLVVGAVGFGVGIGTLWRTKRILLTALNLPLGLLLVFGAWTNRQELGILLWLGLVCLAVGVAARFTWKRTRTDPYDRAAGRLLEGKDDPGLRALRACFDSEGMKIDQANSEHRVVVAYDDMEMILETADLLLVVTSETITTLQKQNLCSGVITDLREALQERVWYIIL